MHPIDIYINQCLSDSEDRSRLAGAAIAQFIIMRDGLRGRIEDDGLDSTAARLTAAVIAGTWHAPDHEVAAAMQALPAARALYPTT